MTETKSISAHVKAIDNDLGIVTHLISVYDIEDYGRDIAHKGMFTKTLKERFGKIRVIDNHQQNSINNVIGKPIDIYEVGRDSLPKSVLKQYPTATGGLMAETQFLMDTPEGAGAFKRIKAEAVTEFSFSYDVMDFEHEQVGGTKIRHLRAVKLYEYGPVIFGMNDAAVSIDAKSDSWDKERKQVEEKACGYLRRASAVRDSFYSKSELRSDESGTDGSWFFVSEVFDDFVLVESQGKDVFYQVGYKEDTDGSFIFAEKSAWIMGSLDFTATEKMDEGKAVDEDEDEDPADSEEENPEDDEDEEDTRPRKLFPILMAEIEMLELKFGPAPTPPNGETSTSDTT